MSAPPDVRSLPPAATPPGGASGRGPGPASQAFMVRHHPHPHQRHLPNSAVSAAAAANYHQHAAAAGLDVSSPSKQRLGQPGGVGVPPGASGQYQANLTRTQNLAAFTAAFASASAAGRPHYDLSQMRVGVHHTTVGLTPGIPVSSYTNSRDAFVRGGPQSGSDLHRVPLSTAAPSSAIMSDLRNSQQVSAAAAAAAAAAGSSQSRLSMRQYPPSLYHNALSSSSRSKSPLQTSSSSSSIGNPRSLLESSYMQRQYATTLAALAMAGANAMAAASSSTWGSTGSTPQARCPSPTSIGSGGMYSMTSASYGSGRGPNKPPGESKSSGLLPTSSSSSSSLQRRSSDAGVAGVVNNSPYLRDPAGVVAAAQHAAGVHLPLHPSASSMNAGGRGAESIPNKRPRLDMTSAHGMVSPHHLQSARAHLSHPMQSNISTPLRIDTRDTAKESGYHPQVEAISPTGPEVASERDELKSSRDDLLQKISKIDREIAKAESQIAKLKKKQQELEDSSSRPLSDEEEESSGRPHNKSIAQIIYAENRRRAKKSHASLAKFAPPNTLPLYNQPSDTDEYFDNKTKHTLIKKRLVEYFKQQNEQKETRERYMLDTYAKLMSGWQKRVERSENMKKRKEREAKSRELYEKIFPELKKQREDKERDHRLGTRGTVRSEADMEDVIERLQERENEDKKMHSYAVVPPLLLATDERQRKFTNNNGHILDPLKEYNERKWLNMWTESEKEIFKEKFLQTPKNFGQIAQFLDRKTVSDCVQYYYLSKKTENYKQLMRRVKVRRGNKRGQHVSNAEALANTAVGVVTRHRNQRDNLQQEQNKENNSNRSTPQPPGIKLEIKADDDDSDKKAGRGSKGSGNQDTNDTSDEEDSTQQVKLGAPGKISNCPIPTCTATKGRIKGRLRHLPKKWSIISKDHKESITDELEIPNGTKKCCSACFTRISRKINQILGGNSLCNSPAEPVKSENDIVWSDDEIDFIKTLLRQHGRSWSILAEKIPAKSPEQCKKFFYNNRRKLGLDRIMLEYKKANQVGDQPPSLSTDEESGSSTSSCDEDNGGINHNSTGTANSNAPASANAEPGTDIKPVIKTEVPIKTEVKMEEGAANSVAPVLNAPGPPNALPGPQGGLTIKALGKEEDYDSSATISADERDGGDHLSGANRHGPPGMFQSQQANFSGLLKSDYPRAGFSGGVPRLTLNTEAIRARGPPQPTPPVPMKPPTNGPTASNPRETITVKELMINVIERSLSGNPNAAGTTATSAANSLPRTLAQGTDPTIHNILEHSGPAPSKQFQGGRVPGPSGAGIKPGSMAPPSAVPSPGHHAVTTGQSSNDCETLDLSMPRRRDPTPPPAQNLIQQPQQYREPQLSHHIVGEAQTPSRVGPPPPAHSGNKVKTNPDPYFRGDPAAPQARQAPSTLIYGPDGRPLSASQLLHSRGPPGSGVGNQPRPAGRPSLAIGYPQTGGPPSSGPSRHAQMSPKLPGSNRTLSGSITQGTPVNQASLAAAAHRSTYDLSHHKGGGAHERVGSITHGTPLYDNKKHPQVINVSDHPKVVYDRNPQSSAEYYRRTTVSPAGAPVAYNYPSTTTATSSSRGSPYVEPHMSSRQVIMNDFAMARSTEMQRRPESREHPRVLSPPRISGRDPSPRPRSIGDRIMPDPRRDVRGLDPRYDPRAIDPRLLPEHRGDPKADLRSIHESRVSLEHRQDLRLDPRTQVGLDARVGLEHRSAALDPRRAGPPPPTSDPRIVTDPRARVDQHIRGYPYANGYYMMPDRKMMPLPSQMRDPQTRTPPRSVQAATPPERSAAIIHRQGSLTSGKPVMPKGNMAHRDVEIYRTNPEVTISKTSSPRHTTYSDNNALASLVDVAVQQPKLPDGKDRAASNIMQQAGAHMQRQVYERQLYDMRVAATSSAGVAPTARSSGADITLQVRNERAKQLSLMTGAKAAGHPAMVGAAATGNGEKNLTAASLIDAIITHSIHTGPNDMAAAVAAGKAGPFHRSPTGEPSSAIPDDRRPSPSPFRISRSPSLKGEAVPEDGSAHGSRPGSRSSATNEMRPPSEVASDMAIHTLGLTNSEAIPEPHWKRRGYLPPASGGNSAASIMPAPRPANSVAALEERSITRVSQPNPPSKSYPESCAPRLGMEPISPPIETHNGSDGRPTSKREGDPGLSPLDYVNSKIVEEMKKNESSGMALAGPSGNGSSNTVGGDSAATITALKRPLENNVRPVLNTAAEVRPLGPTETDESPKKKSRLEDPSGATNLPAASVPAPMTSDIPPADSPGSEGEMVIDESVVSDSAPPSKEDLPKGSVSPAAPPKPQYEPLSDDE